LYTILNFVDNQAGLTRGIGSSVLRLLALIAAPALADPVQIKNACTATSDCAPAMIATYDGLFAKHGLDTEQQGILQGDIDKARLVLT
jgi:NitT/TauT family transport system substrate-binding protein